MATINVPDYLKDSVNAYVSAMVKLRKNKRKSKKTKQAPGRVAKRKKS